MSSLTTLPTSVILDPNSSNVSIDISNTSGGYLNNGFTVDSSGIHVSTSKYYTISLQLSLDSLIQTNDTKLSFSVVADSSSSRRYISTIYVNFLAKSNSKIQSYFTSICRELFEGETIKLIYSSGLYDQVVLLPDIALTYLNIY